MCIPLLRSLQFDDSAEHLILDCGITLHISGRHVPHRALGHTSPRFPYVAVCTPYQRVDVDALSYNCNVLGCDIVFFSPVPEVPPGYMADTVTLTMSSGSGQTVESNVLIAWTTSPDAAADVMAQAEAARVYAADAKLRVEHQRALGVDVGTS